MVGDEREVPAQFDHAGQLAPVLAGLADRTSGCFIYGEHGRSLDLPVWQEQADVLRRTRSEGVRTKVCILINTYLYIDLDQDYCRWKL